MKALQPELTKQIGSIQQSPVNYQLPPVPPAGLTVTLRTSELSADFTDLRFVKHGSERVLIVFGQPPAPRRGRKSPPPPPLRTTPVPEVVPSSTTVTDTSGRGYCCYYNHTLPWRRLLLMVM